MINEDRKMTVRKGMNVYKVGDREMTLAEWLEEPDVKARGLNASTVQSRLNRMWPFKKAIETPRQKSGRPHESTSWLK